MTRSPRRLRALLDSMRVRLMLTIMAVVMLPLVAVVAFVGRWTHDNFDRQSVRIQRQAAAQVESEVRSTILAVEVQLALLDEVLTFAALEPDDQQASLRNLLARNRIYQDLTLVGADGQEKIRVSRAGSSGDSRRLSVDGHGAAASALDTDASHFGPVTFDESLREPLSTVAVPMRDRRTGTVDSVVVATMRFKQIWDLLGEIAEPGGSDVYVVDEDGLVVAHRNPAVVLRGTTVDLPPSDGHSAGLSGQDAVVATQPLGVGGGLIVVAEQPISVALRAAERADVVIVGAMIVGLVVAMALVVVAARHVVRPIEALAESANTIAAGDLSHRAELANRGEVGLLARSFNTMTARLGSMIASLEDRVADRTLELEEAAKVQTQLIEQLEAQASNDFLTGLPNRYALHTRLEIELARARRSGSRVALLLIDLDHFKEVNDTFGHAVGDQLLVAVGRRLQNTLRDVDAVCRLGGDEFAIAQGDIAGRQHAAHLAARLLKAFGESFEIGSHQIFTSVTIGVGISDGYTPALSELIQQADLALYRAKNQGRGGYRFFDDAMDAEIQRRMRLSQDLRGATERGELFLEYQPQVGLADRRIVGVEALLRWRHPELGVVGPTELIPVAESAGLVDEVGQWVLRTACAQALSWRERNLARLPVAVNVSALQVRDEGFATKVSHLLAETGLEPESLELELTETVLMEATEHAGNTLRSLHALGVRIALDDFGRGYASLDYVRWCPLSKIKIDRSFIDEMGTNAKSATIVTSILDLATKLDLGVVAEGVESADLLERLIHEGCEAVQGFYFSRAVSPEVVDELLTVGSDRIRAHRPRPEVTAGGIGLSGRAYRLR